MYQGGATDVSANLALMDNFLSSCALSDNCDIVLFPELFLCGYGRTFFSDVALAPGWEHDSPMRSIIARHGIAAVVGFAEIDRDGRIFNSVAIISGSGKVLLSHRKTHLWGEFEKKNFVPGNDLPGVVSIGEVIISCCICYEIEFPEMARAIRRKGGACLICDFFFNFFLIFCSSSCGARPYSSVREFSNPNLFFLPNFFFFFFSEQCHLRKCGR